MICTHQNNFFYLKLFEYNFTVLLENIKFKNKFHEIRHYFSVK